MERAEYYKERLSQTFEHTTTLTKILYLVDGAVLAMLYFIVDKLQKWPIQNQLEISALLFLAIVNLIHGAFIRRQRKWYRLLDAKFAESLGLSESASVPGLSMHVLFSVMYWGIAALALIGAVLLSLYGPLQPLNACSTV